MPYLLVAEANKIQSFIFQSSKLRQVVGASAMLVKFSQAVKDKPQQYLGLSDQKRYEIISAGGGSFRVRFELGEDAQKAVSLLRQKFMEEVGGSITITTVELSNKKSEVEQGNDALREAKSRGQSPVALWHLPYHALCQSSGSELAVEYTTETDFEDDVTPKYLGAATLKKGRFGKEENVVLNKMRRVLNDYARQQWNSSVGLPDQPTDAETYAWDSRQYVAYLLADGNGMGEAFNACSPEQAAKMSEAIDRITYEALADAVFGLMRVRDQEALTMPILPLIMGGDDVFALMPANWALDVAQRYAHNYQILMTDFWMAEGIKDAIERERRKTGNDKEAIATLGVAVVICKSSYPYKSAHEFGEELLGQVKDAGKNAETPQSMIGINWIVGSSVTNPPDFAPLTIARARELIEGRKRLNDMSSRTREQFRSAADRGDHRETAKILNRYKQGKLREETAELEELLGYLGDDFRMLVSLWDFLLDSYEFESAYTLGARHVS